MKDYYTLLGVSKTASESEIRTSFRKKAKLHHPDLFQNAASSEQKKHQNLFIQLSQAYEALSNPKTRKEYDQKITQKAKERTASSSTGSRSRPRPASKAHSTQTQSKASSQNTQSTPDSDESLEDLLHDVEDLLQGFGLGFRDPLEMLLQWARRVFKESVHAWNEEPASSSKTNPSTSFSSASFMKEIDEELKQLKRKTRTTRTKTGQHRTKIDAELDALKKKFRKF